MCANRKLAVFNARTLSFVLTGIVLLSVFGTGTAVAGSSQQEGTPFVPPPWPGTEPGGPFYHQLHLVRSIDGLTWTGDEVIREHASVPSIVRWNDTLWVYVVDPFLYLTVLRQEGDVWWEARVQIDGFDRPYAVDPDVVTLPDGRVRLYFLDIREILTSTIRSAVSADGVHFADEGIRFQKQSPGTDPDVVRAADGTWWMYVLEGRGAAAAPSTDGLTFTPVNVTDTGPISDTVLLEDGRLRRYYSRTGCILSEVSTDRPVCWLASTRAQQRRASDPLPESRADRLLRCPGIEAPVGNHSLQFSVEYSLAQQAITSVHVHLSNRDRK